MKTLDEVIKALEVCTSGYCSHPKHGDCPYLDERNDCDTRQRKLDALQWLKGYKAHIELDKLRDKYSDTSQITCPKCHSEFVILDDPDGDHQQLLKCQALLQDLYRNEPLTWDELCSRNGMPIWIEDSFDNGEWYIIECFTASNRFVAHDRWGDTTLFNKKEMDDVWKAYRREHHEN